LQIAGQPEFDTGVLLDLNKPLKVRAKLIDDLTFHGFFSFEQIILRWGMVVDVWRSIQTTILTIVVATAIIARK
jgi:hypothetical protein